MAHCASKRSSLGYLSGTNDREAPLSPVLLGLTIPFSASVVGGNRDRNRARIFDFARNHTASGAFMRPSNWEYEARCPLPPSWQRNLVLLRWVPLFFGRDTRAATSLRPPRGAAYPIKWFHRTHSCIRYLAHRMKRSAASRSHRSHGSAVDR